MEHKCKALPGNGLGIYRAENFLSGGSWEWCLVVQRLATAEDLEENHYLEDIGDAIWTTVVEISHCPFCGELLPDARPSPSSPEAAFQYVDSSGWDAKVQ